MVPFYFPISGNIMVESYQKAPKGHVLMWFPHHEKYKIILSPFKNENVVQTKTKAYLVQHQSSRIKRLELFTTSILIVYDWFS